MGKGRTIALVLLVTGFAALLLHADLVSTNFRHIDHAAVAKGGDLGSQAGTTHLGVLDESAVGTAASPNYRSFAGWLYVLPHEPVRILSPPSPPVVGTGGSSTFQWICDWTGTFTLTSGTTTITTGNCMAGVPVNTTVLETDLTDDMNNTLTLTVSAPPNGGSVNVNIRDDRTGPVFNPLEITRIAGAVDDLSITSITVRIQGQPDQNVPVTGGTFTFNAPAGTTTAVLEGGGFVRTVRVNP
jgi:hypothetical protein